MNFVWYILIFVVTYLFMPQVVVSDTTDDLLQLETVKEFVEYFNYSYEEYKVITEDGYILTLHRMPHNNKSSQIGRPVLLIHGLFGSAMSFIIGTPETSLGFILSDANYDVWIMNCRGNIYANEHISLTEKQSNFWNYSFHEMGVYDIPAVIDFILENTSQKYIPIIAYSQGTTASYVLLSEKPQYNAKVKVLISYSPSVYKCRIKLMPLRIIAYLERTGFWTTVRKTTGDFNLIGPIVTYVKPIFTLFCQRTTLIKSACAFFSEVFTNTVPAQINWETFPLVLKHYPFGTGLKSVVHFFQSILKCKFRSYQLNFGDENNKDEYNLNNVDVESFVFYATEDALQDPQDVLLLEKKLKKKYRRMWKLENFGHGDFLHGLNSPALIFKPTLDILNSL